MPLIRTGATGDGLIRPGPGVPTVMPAGECACPTSLARFLLGRVDGTFIVTCDRQKSVEIHLECPAAVPPTLESYPDK
jgi:hypothetical protein